MPLFGSCLKQQNGAEIAGAEVVIAAHDVLFSGFAIKASSVGVIVIDEGCWQRALQTSRGLYVESFAHDLIGSSLTGRNSNDAIADLHDLRQRASEALINQGPLARSQLLRAGLDEAACGLAVQLEARRLRDPGLFPGMSASERRRAMKQVQINERTHRYIEVWQAMQDLAAGDQEHDGRLHVHATANGLHEIVVSGLKPTHPTLRNKPVLHLDATLRPELARSVLEGIEVHDVDAAAPHVSLRLITGSFGKGQLCPAAGLEPREARRRRNRLAEVVDYVRWHAVRMAPGRTLVVTYKAVEDAFRAIPGVDVAHFNAIAGLGARRARHRAAHVAGWGCGGQSEGCRNPSHGIVQQRRAGREGVRAGPICPTKPYKEYP